MARFTVTIDTDDGCFFAPSGRYEPGPELARLLLDLAEKVETYPLAFHAIRSTGGNKVGEAWHVANPDTAPTPPANWPEPVRVWARDTSLTMPRAHVEATVRDYMAHGDRLGALRFIRGAFRDGQGAAGGLDMAQMILEAILGYRPECAR